MALLICCLPVSCSWTILFRKWWKWALNFLKIPVYFFLLSVVRSIHCQPLYLNSKVVYWFAVLWFLWTTRCHVKLFKSTSPPWPFIWGIKAKQLRRLKWCVITGHTNSPLKPCHIIRTGMQLYNYTHTYWYCKLIGVHSYKYVKYKVNAELSPQTYIRTITLQLISMY